MSKLLEGGRITGLSKDLVKFVSSFKDDVKLLEPVIKINKAHLIMLMEEKILDPHDGIKLLDALTQLSNLTIKEDFEDIHMAVEEAIIKKVGLNIGGNLHIAKSRNDQVSTAIRIALKESLIELMSHLMDFEQAVFNLAEKNVTTVVVGYTHLQPAQPITFAHYLLSYFDAVFRDFQRLIDLYPRVDLCPMGAAALATSSFPINRERVANLLGFNNVLENSIDAVHSRDFILETIASLAIFAVNLSRLAEDLIIWCSPEFGLIELPDFLCSTSSIMPQKKNPDVLEVIRARASHVLGNFVTSAAIMKGLPSTYNLDLQEITPCLWTSINFVKESTKIFSKIVSHLSVTEKSFDQSLLSFSTATELANLIVRKTKISFRTAHKIVGSVVKELINSRLTLFDVTLELIQRVASKHTDITLNLSSKDLLVFSDISKLVESYQVKGGPSPKEVTRMLKTRMQQLITSQKTLFLLQKKLNDSQKKLDDTIHALLSTSKDEAECINNT